MRSNSARSSAARKSLRVSVRLILQAGHALRRTCSTSSASLLLSSRWSSFIEQFFGNPEDERHQNFLFVREQPIRNSPAQFGYNTPGATNSPTSSFAPFDRLRAMEDRPNAQRMWEFITRIG